MKFDDFLSKTIHVGNGIGQGDPLSMILYILYNADLLEIVSPPEEESLGFVDDVLAMAEGYTLEENVTTLTSFVEIVTSIYRHIPILYIIVYYCAYIIYCLLTIIKYNN